MIYGSNGDFEYNRSQSPETPHTILYDFYSSMGFNDRNTLIIPIFERILIHNLCLAYSPDTYMHARSQANTLLERLPLEEMNLLIVESLQKAIQEYTPEEGSQILIRNMYHKDERGWVDLTHAPWIRVEHHYVEEIDGEREMFSHECTLMRDPEGKGLFYWNPKIRTYMVMQEEVSDRSRYN